MKQTLLFDIESTGLLRRGSKIHCIVARDLNDQSEPLVFDHKPDRSIDMGIEQLI